ncbi:hypothetical protein HK097_006880, partial [Rhizophlyctis rosea]
RLSVPKEVWRLVDFIYKYGMDVDNLFLSPGDPTLMTYMRECLDTGEEFDIARLLADPDDGEAGAESPPGTPVSSHSESPQTPSTTNPPPKTETIELDISLLLQTTSLSSSTNPTSTLLTTLSTSNPSLTTPQPPLSLGRPTSIHTATTLLLDFLNSLSEPVIPFALYTKCVQEAYHTFVAARNVVGKLDGGRWNLFVYLVGFLREVLGAWRGRGDLGAEKLGMYCFVSSSNANGL